MGNVNVLVSQQALFPARRGRKTSEKRKRRRHTWVKRPTTAYLYFVSKYRETLKEAGEIVPKVCLKLAFDSFLYHSYSGNSGDKWDLVKR